MMDLMKIHLLIILVQTVAYQKLILEFLAQNNSTACIFIVCWSKFEKNEMQKLVSTELFIRTAFPTVQAENIFLVNDGFHGKLSYILDLACPQTEEILKQSSKAGKFRFIYSWLMIHSNTILESELGDLLTGLEWRADMDLNVAIPEISGTRYEIFEVYKLGLEIDIEIRKKNTLRNEKFSFSRNKMTFYESRKNMSGVLMRNANTADYCFDTDEDLANNYRTRETANHGKFYFQIYRNLIDIHQFHYNTTLCDVWFGNTTNGYDAGFGKLLFDDTVDFNSAGGVLRPSRMYYYDFILPFTSYRNCFFYQNTRSAKPSLAVLKPFTTQTWYATVGVALVMCMALWMENAFSRYKIKYSFFTVVVTSISIFAQQGSPILPDLIGGRFILLILLVLSILLYNYYTSSLVSSLLSSKPFSFTTIKELAESGLRAGLEDTPYVVTYIVQQRDDEDVQKLNSTKLYKAGKPNFLSPAEGIALVKKGGFAYHTNIVRAYSLIAMTFEEEQICDLVQIDFITPGYLGLMLQKNSQYTELMKISLTKMLTTGILSREEKFWTPRKPECLLNSIVVPVGMNGLTLVYVIIIAGLVIAFFLLTLEIIWSRIFEDDETHSRKKKFNLEYH